MALIPRYWADRTHSFALILIAMGLPLSRVLMSIGAILLLLEGLFGADPRERAKNAFRDPAALWLIAFYGIHLLGLLHSSELEYAFKDLRVKAPLLLFPLVLGGREGGTPLRPVLIAFLSAFFLSGLLSYTAWSGWLELPWKAEKEATLFISAIRLSLMGCMALFFAFFLFQERKALLEKVLLLCFAFWTLFYLGILATGISMLVLLALCLYMLERWRRRKRGWVPLLLMILLLLTPPVYIGWETRTYFHVKEAPINKKEELPRTTEKGNPYTHHTHREMLENGYYTWLFICEPELKEAWNARSEIPYEGKDEKGNALSPTLIRYMSSKGLKKDAEGMEKMSDADIRRVEKGVANLTLHRMNPIRQKVRRIIFELHHYARGWDPSGNSIAQRFEYWRAGWHIIQENPWIGVGTGDLKKAFEEAYEAIDSPLKEEYRLRAHQQFLSCWIAWGPAGLLLFLAALFIPPLRKKAFRDPYYCIFFIALFLSFFTEDTLETQAGVTLFAFWNAFLLFGSARNGDKGAGKARTL